MQRVTKERKEKSMFIEILKAILFGIVEGITEWLPISSTGHLIDVYKRQGVYMVQWKLKNLLFQY